jgi:hypothetical protein
MTIEIRDRSLCVVNNHPKQNKRLTKTAKGVVRLKSATFLTSEGLIKDAR